jgi:hypothetical protein
LDRNYRVVINPSLGLTNPKNGQSYHRKGKFR